MLVGTRGSHGGRPYVSCLFLCFPLSQRRRLKTVAGPSGAPQGVSQSLLSIALGGSGLHCLTIPNPVCPSSSVLFVLSASEVEGNRAAPVQHLCSTCAANRFDASNLYQGRGWREFSQVNEPQRSHSSHFWSWLLSRNPMNFLRFVCQGIWNIATCLRTGHWPLSFHL